MRTILWLTVITFLEIKTMRKSRKTTVKEMEVSVELSRKHSSKVENLHEGAGTPKAFWFFKSKVNKQKRFAERRNQPE